MDIIFKIESFELFKTVIEEMLKNLHRTGQNSVTEIESNVFEAAKDDLRKLIYSNNFDIQKIAEEISTCFKNEEKCQWFISVIGDKKTHLFYSIILHHNSMYGDAVTHYNWFLKLIFGTSESKVVKYSLLQLIFNTVNSNGEQKNRLYDINKECLGKLIEVLECCKDL